MKDLVLFQESWRRRPFWMLVGCILVNRTQWADAQIAHKELLQRWPTPYLLAHADPAKVRGVVWGLGLGNVRAVSIVNFAAAWSRYGRTKKRTSSDILKMPGCGKYAADSWAIFVEGRRPKGVTDKKLKAYLLRKGREWRDEFNR